MEVRDTFAHALPDTTSLQLNTWYIDDAHAQITLLISSAQVAPHCPGCDAPARSVHSRYIRTLADLPWGGYGITWRLHVRNLFCRNPACARRIFTERLPGLVAPWARRTLRLAARLLAMGLALGGAAGVRLSRQTWPKPPLPRWGVPPTHRNPSSGRGLPRAVMPECLTYQIRLWAIMLKDFRISRPSGRRDRHRAQGC